MSLKKQEWPEIGDLVMATIKSITEYGAYVKLDEYDKKGLLHISEIASRWIRNIRAFIREDQKVVLKVLSVNREKEHIDLSLRRVTKRERIEKVKSWKKERKAETLLGHVAEKINLPIAEVYEKAGVPMEKEYGLYEGFEIAAKKGVSDLTKIGIPQELAVVISDIAKDRIKLSMVKIKGVVSLQVMKPEGVKIIKKIFLDAKKAEKSLGVSIRFYVIAAPKYCIEIIAENYKKAEKAIQKIAENIISSVTKAGGQGFFRREK
jgi:translation initiation factor 2 subunit 1